MASIGNDSNLVFDVDDDFGFGRDDEDEELQQQAEEQPIDDDFGFGREEQEEELEQQPEEPTTEETDNQHQQQLATVPTIQQPEEQEVAVAVSVIKKRRRFTIQEKLIFLRRVNRKMESGMTQCAACHEINIDHKQICDWRKKSGLLKAATNKKARCLHPGVPSMLQPYTDCLLSFIFELRETGMAVSNTIVLLKAAQICRDFREKSRSAQYYIVRRFIKIQGLVYRMGTHVSQRAPAETESEARDFIMVTRPKVSDPCRHQDYVLNMDQTPIPFSFNQKSTLELIGRRTVHVRKSMSDTKRATCALTITASGKMLDPLMVFKGKPNGRIVTREFPEFPDGILYTCQDNAWMDEKVMLQWVKKILKPYVDGAPDEVVPLLFLDSYRCHIMGSVVTAIQNLGVEVEHIPGGCTCLCQPVDVGVNKPFKKLIRDKWEQWMISEGIVHGTTSPPTRKQIAEWTLHAKSHINQQIIQNSWRHGEYSWFLMDNNNNNNNN